MNVDDLIEALVEERSLEALEELTMSGSDEVVEALLQAAARLILNEDYEDTDDRIVETIRQHIVRQRPVGLLMDALASGSATKREFALACLSEIGDTKAVPAMVTLLGDKDEAVVEAAAEHLALLTHYDFGKDAERWRDWHGRLVKGQEEQAKEAQEDQQRLLRMQMKGYRSRNSENEDELTDGDDDDRGRYREDDDLERGRYRDDDDDDRGRARNDDDGW